MKYLIVLLVVAVAVMLWRSNRDKEQASRARKASPPPAPPAPQDMVKCASCPVHLPRAEALAGPSGRLYCSAEHRRLSET